MGGKSDKVGPPFAHLLETEVDGDISLYDPSSERVTVLNGTASDIWRLADGEHTVAEITNLLANSYGMEPASIAPDVLAVVTQFIEAGLVTRE